MIEATPASSKRRAISSAVSAELSAQPSTATLPSRASGKPDRDPAGMRARGRLDQGRVAHRRGADDHAAHALAEPAFDRRHVADAAAELERDVDAGEDALDRLRVDRLAGEGAVEIDHMQIREALRREGARLRGRVALEHRRARHVTLFQAHADAVLEIDCRKQDHGDQARKFAISRSPSRWLFSGWNWVPTMVSRPTMAVTAPP